MKRTDEVATVHDLRKIAEVLDTKFVLPGGWRVGWDGIIGLIPFFGDFVTGSLSLYIIVRGILLGCPPSVVFRMGLNVLVDNLCDIVPLLGNLFDFFWKSNTKNIRLIEAYVADPRRTLRRSRSVIFLMLAGATAFVLALLSLAFVLARWLWLFASSPS